MRTIPLREQQYSKGPSVPDTAKADRALLGITIGAGALGAAITALRKKPAEPPPDRNVYQDQQDQKRNIMAQTIAQGQQDQGLANNERYQTFKALAGVNAMNQQAEKTRLGGQYTPAGMELAAQDATVNADDRLRARSMIGIGGTEVPGSSR